MLIIELELRGPGHPGCIAYILLELFIFMTKLKSLRKIFE